MISIKYIAAKNKIIEKPSKMYLIIVCNLFLVLCHLKLRRWRTQLKPVTDCIGFGPYSIYSASHPPYGYKKIAYLSGAVYRCNLF